MRTKLYDRCLEVLNDNKSTLNFKLKKISEILQKNIEYYHWVGFYFLDKNKENLILGPFSGKDTDHKTIPVGRGICGQVALSNRNFVVQDVSKESNYLSCNINVKSEIVIPIFKNKENIGQIDIDSNVLSPFTKKDEIFLEKLCIEISKIL
jgi:GAF domain-containing protein